MIQLLLGLALLASSEPHGSSGMSLLAMCEDAEGKKPLTTDSASCASYIIGSVDASLFWNPMQDDGTGRVGFCAPEPVTYLQYVAVVVKFLRDHPERLHESRQLLVQVALREAFPCRPKQLRKDVPREQQD